MVMLVMIIIIVPQAIVHSPGDDIRALFAKAERLLGRVTRFLR